MYVCRLIFNATQVVMRDNIRTLIVRRSMSGGTIPALLQRSMQNIINITEWKQGWPDADLLRSFASLKSLYVGDIVERIFHHRSPKIIMDGGRDQELLYSAKRYTQRGFVSTNRLKKAALDQHGHLKFDILIRMILGPHTLAYTALLPEQGVVGYLCSFRVSY